MQAKGSSDADALRNRQYSADCTRLELNSKTFAIHFVWQESFLFFRKSREISRKTDMYAQRQPFKRRKYENEKRKEV